MAEWGRRVVECDKERDCLEDASRQLRDCLDKAFPDSERSKLQSDKVNYMLSSVFFLANRLAKASQGLAEFDKATSTTEAFSRQAEGEEEREEVDYANQAKTKEFKKELDEILAKYF
ncbi:MAG TPA: hypothetical protein VJP79_03765 [Nitrososphaera sp.]|nr:hypothetical protein [Nitrososphaera sp.]